MKKSEKGITMVALVITITVLLIVTVSVAINSSSMINVVNINDLESDIELLRQKVSNFYNEYGEIPASIEYTNISSLQPILNNKELESGSKFYVLDLQAMKGITLNFGKDYEVVKDLIDVTTVNAYTDLYIINKETHNIFYVEGVQVNTDKENSIHYTDYVVPENIPQ